MHITKISVKNYRGYTSLEMPLDPQFNLIVGDNGSGKTAILEALTVAMGAFFLGIRGTNARDIRPMDIRVATYETNEEQVFPVVVKAEGIVDNKKISWSRELNSGKGRTLAKKASEIKKISSALDDNVRQGENVILPLLVYYSTGRLWRDTGVPKKSNEKQRNIASRFRAYYKCLQATSTFKEFLKWFKGKELSNIQKGEKDFSYKLVKETIVNSLPNCKNIYYEFDPDKPEGLKIVHTDASILPFDYLSDGMRNLLALVADIAYKCVLLNPSLKENSIKKTTGIVLIDELDLHLHPNWQKLVVSILKNNFPCIQFVASTHSPFLIQETEAGQLVKLIDNKIIEISGANNQSIEDIAEYVQDVQNPQWSSKRIEMYEVARKYYQALENEKLTDSLKV